MPFPFLPSLKDKRLSVGRKCRFRRRSDLPAVAESDGTGAGNRTGGEALRPVGEGGLVHERALQSGFRGKGSLLRLMPAGAQGEEKEAGKVDSHRRLQSSLVKLTVEM